MNLIYYFKKRSKVFLRKNKISQNYLKVSKMNEAEEELT